MPETATQEWRTRSVVALATTRRTVRSGVMWGALFGVLAGNEALQYHSAFPTRASRTQFAESFGSNAGLTAVTGPARHLDTIGGFVSWRMFSLMLVVAAVWGLLTATRLLRAEEDAGRWELLLSGRTARRQATVQALAGLAAGFFALWAVTAALMVAAGLRPQVGFSVWDSVFYATAGTASAAVFLSIGALTSQLAPTRRQANALGAAVLGVAFVIRMVADGGTDLGWLRWASPLGWVENLAPLTDPQPVVLVPVVLLVAATSAAAVVLAGRRDVGVGILTRSSSREPHTRLLDGTAGLTVRLERWVAVSWVAGLALAAVVFGLVAQAAAAGEIGDRAVGQVVGEQTSLAAGWIGYELLYLAAILAFAAAGQVSALRGEEADGQLDNLLARPLDRRTWLASRLAFGVLLVLASGLAIGVGGWLGARQEGIGLGSMLEAGLNTAVPGLVVLGLGTLLYGFVPRLVAPVLYAFVLWSFLVEIIGTSITDAQWFIDTSVLEHLGPVPATSPDWSTIGWLIGLAAVGCLAGLAAFTRRDLEGA